MTLVAVKCPPSLNDAEIIPDYKVIKVDLLIENIYIAFKLRNESQWAKKSTSIPSANSCWHICKPHTAKQHKSKTCKSASKSVVRKKNFKTFHLRA